MLNVKECKKFKVLVFLLAVYSFVFTPSVSALELVVTDNGTGSDNEVNVQVETETNVVQTNEADVENTVIEDLNTGGNIATGNTDGDVNIQTGDINTATSIDNQLNSNYAKTEPCCSTVDIEISDNGSNSDNTVNLDFGANTVIEADNIASVSNTIMGKANTGENKALDNTGGSVSINTGDINVQNQVVNDSVNTSFIETYSGFSDVSAAIKDNGEGSDNTINADFNDDLNVLINHSSDIENYILWEAETGANEASGNTGGDVSITTGDINIVNFIENLVNIGGVDVDCCEGIYDPEDGNDEDENSDNTPSDGHGGNSSSDSGSSSTSGSILDSAAATEAGGPGIAGLSDTSSESAKTMFFWLSFAFIIFGGKIIVEELLTTSDEKRYN